MKKIRHKSLIIQLLLITGLISLFFSCAYLVKGPGEAIDILFFGDLMIDRGVGARISENGMDHLFSLLNERKFTENYDLVMANLEGAVTDGGAHYDPKNPYDFAFTPERVAKLRDYGFNIFTGSNNHISDQGSEGIRQTYRNMSALGYYYFGCRDGYISPSKRFPEVSRNLMGGVSQQPLSEDDCSAIIMEIKNKRIAFFSFCMVYAGINTKTITDKIHQLKSVSDYVIVCPHWGLEYKPIANEQQVSLGHAMIDAGADAVIAHHPHVIQNYELYNDKPIFYSLGNFIFDQYFSAPTQEGLSVALRLSGERITYKVYKISTRRSKIEEITAIL